MISSRFKIVRRVLIALLVATLGPPGSAFGQLRAQLVVSGLVQPVAFVQDPTQPDVQLVVQQGGRIRVVQNGALLAADFLDLTAAITSGGERGLLGLAFAPNYASSGWVFVKFTDLAGNTVVARFTRDPGNPLRADPASRFDLLWPVGTRYIGQPFANHNGGHLAFGPDGYLYIGMGDGGAANDPFHNAQNPMSLLGKMLRIDIAVPASDPIGYRVPANNPFVGVPSVFPEIWAFGLRNPWRYNFDDPARGGTGALVIADVGQAAWEEIDYEPAGRGGRNYGWRNREGANPNDGTLPPFSLPLTDPIFQYSRAVGASVTGGFVYRGTALGSTYRGRYFFGDFSFSRVWSIRLDVNPLTGEATAADLVEHTAELSAGAGFLPSSFGLDASGELYIVSYSGSIYRVSLALSEPPGGGGRKSRPPADFDGDRKQDVAVFRPSDGVWYVRNQFSVQWGEAGDVPVPGDYDGDGLTDVTVWRPSDGTWYVRGKFTVQWGEAGDVPVPGDYNGDGLTDVAVWRRSTGTWYVRGQFATQWGEAGDVPVPGDYNGDGLTDVAVWRRSTGTWYVLGQFATQWGEPGDVAVPGDYNGDGSTDVAVWRRSTGTWYVLGQFATQWGEAGDVPVPGDYSGDSLTDVAVWRPSTGEWFVRGQFTVQWGGTIDIPVASLVRRTPVEADFNGDRGSDVSVWHPSTGEWFVRGQFTIQWGGPGDVPVPDDYNGDGLIDLAVWRPSTGEWFVRGQFTIQWGGPGDVPVPGDYDGDGLTDVAVWRPSTGEWSVRNQFTVQWGGPGDVPVPGDYNGDGLTDVAVWRPSTGIWSVRNQFTAQWGEAGDVPIPRDYNADGLTDVAVWRPSTGIWFVRHQFTIQWGGPGDVPVLADYNGDGLPDVAVWRPSTGEWFVRSQFTIQWGGPGDVPIGGGR